MSVKSPLQEAKDLLQEKEVAYSLLLEQHAQASRVQHVCDFKALLIGIRM